MQGLQIKGLGGINAGLPVLLLIAANLIPLFGVLYLGWTVGAILLVYWLESVIIGVLNIPRIFSAQGGVGNKLFTSLFFSVHYGIFTMGHLVFLRSMFGADEAFGSIFTYGPMFWTALSFFISHLVSLIARIYRGEFNDSTPSVQLFAPYSRVVIMHIVVLFGAFLIQKWGSPIYVLLLLVILKTGVDLIAHKREGREARRIESLVAQ